MTDHIDKKRSNTPIKPKTSRIISCICWFGAGLIIVFGIIFHLDIMLPGILIFSGLALIFEQLSRKTYVKIIINNRGHEMKKNTIGSLGILIIITLIVSFIVCMAIWTRDSVISFFSITFAVMSCWRLFLSIKAKSAVTEQKETIKEHMTPNTAESMKYTAARTVIFVSMGLSITWLGIWMYTMGLGIFPSFTMSLAGILCLFYPKPIKLKQNPTEPVPNVQNIEDKITLNNDVEPNLSVIDQCKAYAIQIDKAAAMISEKQIKRDLLNISRYVTDIFKFAEKNEAVESQIRKFANIYLPITIKMCNQYIELSEIKQEASTAKELKSKIAEGIENAKTAFAKLNDNLLQNISFDIEAELKAFQNILTIDGLLGDELMMPKKDSEQEEV